jgi:hypothetical protein
MADQIRRDYLIGQAVQAGKFTAARAPFYQEMYDRDPAGTEQILAMLGPALAGVRGLDPAEQQPYPRSLFPELDRRARRQAAPPAIAGNAPEAAEHARPVTPAAEVDLSPDQVGAWSHQLGFDTAAKAGRVTRDEQR